MYWSPSTRTALAEAELEYPEESFAFQSMTLHCTWEASCWEDHVSPSIYVAFKCTQSGTKPCFFWVKRRVTQRSDLDYIAAKDS